MRLTLCYRILRSRGFFLGKNFYPYRSRLVGYATSLGFGHQARAWLGALKEGGVYGVGSLRSLIIPRPAIGVSQRLVNVGFNLLRLQSPFVQPLWPAAWAVLRYLQIRHFRGQRYKLGLPARGQRTHSNAATSRRVRNAVATYLRTYYWFSRLWEPRKRPTLKVRSKFKSQSKRAAKAERHRKGVVRTKDLKKKDVWR